MRRAAWILLVLASLATVPAAAQGIRATIDRQEIALDEVVYLTLTVIGTDNPQPELPELSDFTVRNAGQGSQFQVINGQVSVNVSFRYQLAPKRVGDLAIGPVKVTIGGKVYASQPITIKVTAAARAPEQAASRDLFVTTEVSNPQPYAGEQVIYTWRFYNAVQIGTASLGPSEMPGFQVEELGELKDYQKVVNGRPFAVHEFRRALFPQQPGNFTLSGPPLNVTVYVQRAGRRGSVLDQFFGGGLEKEERTLQSPPVEVRVRPLPAPPPGFSGLVGKFDIEASLSKSVLAAGESTNLRVTIAGSGNAQMIGEPTMPDLPGFKLYQEKPVATLDRSGERIRGRKTFVKDLIPLRAGSATVPALSLIYFDPAKSAYVTAATTPFSLTVNPGQGREDLRLTESVAPGNGKVEVQVFADDLLPLAKDPAAAIAPGAFGRQAWILGLLLPPLAFCGLWAWRRRGELPGRDGATRRRKQALKRALAAARQASEEAAAGRRDEALWTVSRSLRELVGDRLGRSGAALTPAEVEQTLAERGLPEELVRRCATLASRLEAARYGTLPIELTTLLGELPALLSELDEALGRIR